jgi:hypothetical protein
MAAGRGILGAIYVLREIDDVDDKCETRLKLKDTFEKNSGRR